MEKKIKKEKKSKKGMKVRATDLGEPINSPPEDPCPSPDDK